MVMGARFSSQHSSPSQTWSPRVNFHGNVIFTSGLMTTPLPTEAPKHRSTVRFSGDRQNGHHWNSTRLTTSQRASLTVPAPRSNSSVENFDRSTSISIRNTENGSLRPLSTPQYTGSSLVPTWTHNSLCEHKHSAILNMMTTPHEDAPGKRVAVSYLRFSTPEQALGDSERRQIALAEAYCAHNGLALSKEAVADRGRSAYHGAHRTAGNLGALLKRLKPGQVLLIEDCDRWSREPVIDSLTALRDTVRKGIEVVFMRTSTRVTAENFDSPEVLYPNFFGSVLANTESKKKGERLQAGWQAKHTKARTGQPVRLNRPPCWLRWNQDAGKYEEDKAKAAVVRSLFEFAGAGHGLLSIVRIMKAKGTPPLTAGASAAWNLSTLRRILLSKEALGYYCPTDGSQPAPGFYPPVVSEKVFYAAQGRLAIAKRIVRRLGHGDGNLFTGLAFCTCGATLMLHGGRLVCGGTRKGGACGFRGAPVRALERALFEFLADARLVRPMLAGEQKPTRMDALAGGSGEGQKGGPTVASVIV